MASRIINIYVHDLTRDDGGLTVRLGRPDLSVSPTVQRVIDELVTLYARRT